MSGASDSDQDQQIAAYLDDGLDVAAHAEFEQRLASEPALARRLAAHLLLEVELRGHRTAPSARQPVVRQTPVRQAPVHQTPVRQTPVHQPSGTKKIARRRARTSAIPWPAVLASAAALVVAVMLAWPAARPLPSAVEVDLAVVSTAVDAVSVDGSRTLPTVLRLGQTLRVRPRATATLRWRGEATEAVVTATGDEAVVRLSENGLTLEVGAVDAVVAPRAQDRAFRITAGDAAATVLGTRFRIERQGPRTRLAVTSGRVELRQGEAARVVDAGGSAIADASGVVMNGAASTGVDLERGLFARWSGDGLDGNRLRDLGPGGHHGDATGVQVVAGRNGKALHFDGERSLLTIPHSDDVTIGDPAKPFSVALWLRVPVGSTHEQNLLSKGRTTAQPGPTLAMCLMLSGGNRIDLYRWNENGDTDAPKLESSGWNLPRLDDGAWHHVAVVCEHATLRRCYHNGVEVGTDTTLWRNDTRNRTRWSLGRLENMGFTKEDPLTGDLEDVRVYDRVLMAAEVAALGGVGR